jgi:Zn-finger nucleic acid-binding protein
MIIVELDEVEIDYCSECEGIWLDAGELELLLVEKSSAGVALEDANTDEVKRRCPICMRKMLKKNIDAGNTKVLIDACRQGDGLWFDGGELKDVLKGLGADGNVAIEHLARLFG